MLAGERRASAGARARGVRRVGLVAEGVVVLMDGDGVAALGECVGGAEAGDATAEDGEAPRRRLRPSALAMPGHPRRWPRRPLQWP
ncbi:hypothetical protein GCM10010320_10940 [Streptomyces caelestis]|uniref:Uncharacterized protein n=1 Tax=Streptomyces caelestis TaxID=36816 RepID=A0A7W9H7D3_9ACTN|nr:hypothetical protein [Streptomyces caelestis]GGW33725.1 hypothetical protein GCM10010320_10940 [Streptomyces caelestis]